MLIAPAGAIAPTAGPIDEQTTQAGTHGPTGEDCTPHPPIRITEDEGPEGFVLDENPATGEPIYRPGSGVVAGNGTAEDPYVIAGWCIVPEKVPTGAVVPGSDDGIFIEGTSAHVVIRDTVVEGDHDEDEQVRSNEIGIRIAAPNVEIRHTSVLDHETGIELTDAPGNVVVDNTIRDNDNGILVAGAWETRIADNWMAGNTDSIRLVEAHGASIVDNVLEPQWRGVDAWDSEGVLVEDNEFESGSLLLDSFTQATVRGNDFEGGGIVLDATDGISIDETNTVNGDPVRFIRDETDVTVPSPAGQVILVDTTRATVEGLSIENTAAAIQVHGAHETRIEENTLTGNRLAIDLLSTSETEVVENQLDANERGIYTAVAKDTLVHNNNIEASNELGLRAIFTQSPIDARDNWWGDPSGPSGGVDDHCSDAVADGDGAELMIRNGEGCFAPWRSSPVPFAGVDG